MQLNFPLVIFTIMNILIFISPQCLAEIYKWVDVDGVTHISDRKPISQSRDVDVKEMKKKDIKTNVVSEPSSVKLQRQKLIQSYKKDSEKKKKIAAEKEKERIKNKKRCARANKHLRGLKEGWRFFSEDDQQERVYMSEEERAKRIKKLDAILDSDCSG